MYFNNISNQIGNVPLYFIDDILEHKDKIITVAAYTAILGHGCKTCNMGKMEAVLQNSLSSLNAYILSQQFPILKHMVVREVMLAENPALTGKITMPTRYLNRVGECLIVPMSGTCTIESTEFPDIGKLSVGGIFRINNRVNSTWTFDKDFLAATFTFLDFDLNKYLMPHDIKSPFPRRPDEFPAGTIVSNIPTEQNTY